MIKANSILFRYLAWEFLTKFLLFFSVLIGIIYLFEVIELIRQASGHHNIPIQSILRLALYKLPDVGQQILPFIILFSAIATFRSLSDRQELVCIRGAGLSIWQFITPLVVTTFILGLLYISVFNPLAAAAMSRYETLKNLYFENNSETITVIDDGLWIRQQDKTGNFILKADNLDAKNWIMGNVTIFFFDKNNTHLQRIDAETAELKDHEWLFKKVSVHQKGNPPKRLQQLNLATTLTSKTLAESFSDPQSMSFWQLPHFIKTLKSTGLDTTDMELYYHFLLSQPLFLISMVFLAGVIALRTQRVNSLLPIVVGGLFFGFLVFFMTGFLRALGLGHEVPVAMAVWSSPFILLLGTITILIRLEDG